MTALQIINNHTNDSIDYEDFKSSCRHWTIRTRRDKAIKDLKDIKGLSFRQIARLMNKTHRAVIKAYERV